MSHLILPFSDSQLTLKKSEVSKLYSVCVVVTTPNEVENSLALKTSKKYIFVKISEQLSHIKISILIIYIF